MQAIGEITAFYENIATGARTPVLTQKNLILFEGADVMAALLSGDMSHQISHMYFQFQNRDPYQDNHLAIDRTSGRATLETADNQEDWLRVPLITNPKLMRMGDTYVANGVYFTGTSAASDSLVGGDRGLAFGNQQSSTIFALALAAAPTPANDAQDKLFSRVILETPIPVRQGSHIVFFWLIKFS